MIPELYSAYGIVILAIIGASHDHARIFGGLGLVPNGVLRGGTADTITLRALASLLRSSSGPPSIASLRCSDVSHRPSIYPRCSPQGRRKCSHAVRTTSRGSSWLDASAPQSRSLRKLRPPQPWPWQGLSLGPSSSSPQLPSKQGPFGAQRPLLEVR